MADPKVGTGKKPKGSDRRLYTDENPSFLCLSSIISLICLTNLRLFFTQICILLYLYYLRLIIIELINFVSPKKT